MTNLHDAISNQSSVFFSVIPRQILIILINSNFPSFIYTTWILNLSPIQNFSSGVYFHEQKVQKLPVVIPAYIYNHVYSKSVRIYSFTLHQQGLVKRTTSSISVCKLFFINLDLSPVDIFFYKKQIRIWVNISICKLLHFFFPLFFPFYISIILVFRKKENF